MEVEITARGGASEADKEYARSKIGGLEKFVNRPILGVRVRLIREENPRIERPFRAEAEVDVNGRLVRGRVAEASMNSAIDLLQDHLQRQLRRLIDRRITARKQPAEPGAGEWRHGSWAPPRPTYLALASEERELVRGKSTAAAPMAPVEAAADLYDLDHDFYLFHNIETGCDAVVYRREDGGLGLIEPQPAPAGDPTEAEWLAREPSRNSDPISLATALAEMDELHHRFLYFVDSEGGRGKVIYQRYDGHYGLIEPAS